MTRRWPYGIGVGVNAGCGLINLAIAAWQLRAAGHSPVGNLWSAAISAVVIWGLTAIDAYAQSKQAILAAALRSQDALAAMHEDMLAKVKQSRIEIGGELMPEGDDLDRPRRRH